MQKENSHSDLKFLGTIGLIIITFGCIVALYDVMHSPMLSSLAGLAFILVGGTCALLAAGGFLQSLDETHHS